MSSLQVGKTSRPKVDGSNQLPVGDSKGSVGSSNALPYVQHYKAQVIVAKNDSVIGNASYVSPSIYKWLQVVFEEEFLVSRSPTGTVACRTVARAK
jgi:hypothetical protein